MKTNFLLHIFCLLAMFLLASGPMYSQELVFEKVWETDTLFLTPEAVVYDAQRQLLYVSNYNRFPRGEDVNDFISALDLEGNLRELRWIEGLKAPTGMHIHMDRLYVVDREGIHVFSLENRSKERMIPIAERGFLNDVVVGDEGTIYFTDTSPRSNPDSRIGRIRGTVIDTLADEGISRANGLYLEDGLMLVGNSGDFTLKKVDLKSGLVTPVARMDTGIIDGIQTFGPDSFLVSHWEGRIYLVTLEGQVRKILDLEDQKINTADFLYIREKGLLVIPGFRSCKVVAYRVR